MKKNLLLLASVALLLSTNSFADCRRDTVNNYNVFANNVKSPSARFVSTFDAKGNQLTEQYQFYSNSTFENSKLTTKTYNANNKVLSSVEQTYDAGSSQWVNNKKFELTYTGSNVADSITSSWDAGLSSWTENVRLSYTYNVQGKLLSVVYKNQTVNNSKQEYTYDANGNQTLYENFGWVSGAWVPSLKEERTFNAANKVSVQTNFSYNQGTSSYVNGQQLAFDYDANNNETQKEFRDWNGSQYASGMRETKSWNSSKLTETTRQIFQGNWVTVERNAHIYNVNGLLSEVVAFRLQGGPPTLQIDSRVTYDYNTAGQLTTKANQTYNAQTTQYSTTSSEQRQYSTTGKLTRNIFANIVQGIGLVPNRELLFEYNSSDDLIATETRNGFNVNNSQWNSIVREEYACGTNQVSGIGAVSQMEFALYPNPSIDNVTLVLDGNEFKVVITDMLGKVVFERAGAIEQAVVSTRDFAGGIYFVSVESKGQKGTKRLAVKK